MLEHRDEANTPSCVHAHASFDRNFFFDFRRRKNVGRSCFSISFFSFIYFLFFFKRSKRFFFFLFFFSLFPLSFCRPTRADIKMHRTSQPSAFTKIQKVICFIQVLIVLSSQKPQFSFYHDLFSIH